MTGFGAAAVVVAGDSESDSDSKDENDDDSFTMISSCFISLCLWVRSHEPENNIEINKIIFLD